MRDDNYKYFEGIIIRSPLLAFIPDITHKKIMYYISDDLIQEAIYVASPVLYNELVKCLNNDEQDDKAFYSIVRYLSRMSTRCTPFGLFAGCTIGKIADETNIILQDSFDRKTRLDMFYLCKLYDSLINIPEIRNEIVFYPNTSLYLLGKNYRYIEYQYIKQSINHQINEIERTIYVDRVLKIAQKGVTIPILISNIVSNEITKEDAIDFIVELINSQILVGELSQSVTGTDYLERIIYRLKSFENAPVAVLSSLERINEFLKRVDKGINNYKKIIDSIRLLDVSYDENYLFQIDISPKMVIAELAESVLHDLKLGVEFLNRVTLPYENEMLNVFVSEFYTRYEEKEIPLLSALDTEFGIGYPAKQNNDISPLIDDLYLPLKTTQQTLSLNQFQSILLKKTIDCVTKQLQEIEFTDDDICMFKANWNDLPPTFSVVFDVINPNVDNSLLRIKSCGGNSGTNLLSRFAYLDENIEDLISKITKKEDEFYVDKIVAEIIHLPESRTGNVLYRPHIRKYEIPYLGSTDIPNENIVCLTDLYLSVKNKRLVIRSKKIGKEIIPRLSTAHNYHLANSLPVYRFLCDMQVQNCRANLCFSWGEIDLPFYPRIRYKNIVISEAKWKIKIEDIKHLFLINDNIELIEKAKSFIDMFKMPDNVLLSDGDNELFVNWTNPLLIRSLFHIIKNRVIVIFKEFLFDYKNPSVVDEKGKAYVNEFILTLYKDKK